MDLEKVKVFVAVEPNEYMHKELRAKAAARGFFESPKDGERRLVIISHGAEELDSIKRMLEVSGVTTVDTIISFLTFCSVPNSTTVLPSLIKATLRPGGTLIYFEHVRSHRPDVAFWQRAWSPIWSIGFDGCQLDIPSDIIIHGMKADDGEEFWKERKAWGLPDEDIENIWWHQLGQYTRL
jgi:SAM-dependent methyltransferase